MSARERSVSWRDASRPHWEGGLVLLGAAIMALRDGRDAEGYKVAVRYTLRARFKFLDAQLIAW